MLSDEDVRICSSTGWYKRVLDPLNIQIATDVPYTHRSNPLCKRQNHVVEQNFKVLTRHEPTESWVRLLPRAVLAMN